VRFEGSEVEPDLMVRQPPSGPEVSWDTWPVPILVVEVLSDSTRRRDRAQKRDLYMDAGVGEYWMVDAERREITAVRGGHDDRVARDRLEWMPSNATDALTVGLEDVFR
jgi:Uma2 family endonuclease